MNRIEFNHWFVNGNELSINFLQWHVTISLVNDEGKVSFVLKVSNEEKEISLSFNEIEDAVVFTENIVRYSSNFEEMINIYYNTLYDQKRYRLWRHDYGSKK